MKRSSNFLKSSKDKLTKGFNSAKCKTSLKMASSRLKLLRNKKEVQVKQMKRELGQLLESGQNQTARIRVEHVVREEKMMAAYDLLEIYCELIVARLPIIESQKNCPIDLKEAITSVVFAAPRCGDVPELVDARKHFTVKYGKEFITTAIELRPDCGVSRLLIEKLSAKAPDGQTKLKILTAIAEEQGIKWDSNSFGESGLPPSELLNGPNTFEKAAKVHEEPPPFEYRDVRTPTTHSQLSNESSKSSEKKRGGNIGTVLSSSSQPEQRHSGLRSERTEVGQSFPEDGYFSTGGQNWNMEFTDAASAAQAAAESAERASMAARAAAKLSRMTGKYQTESQRSGVSIEPQGYSGAASIKKAEQHHQDLPDRSFTDGNSNLQDEVGGSEHDKMMKASRKFYHDGGDSGRSSGSPASLRSEISIDDELPSPEEPGRSREKNLSEEEQGEVKKVANKHSSKFEPECMSGYEEDINYFGDERTTAEVDNVPSGSHPSTSMDVNERQNRRFRYEGGNNLFVNAEEEHVHRGNMKSSSCDLEPAFFDKSSSDDDDDDAINFRTEPLYDDQHAKFYFPSPERKLATQSSITDDYWSPRLNISGLQESSSLTSQFFVDRHSPPESPKSLEEEAYGGKPQAENFTRATFDDSDGMNSETEDIDHSDHHSKHSQTRGSRSSEVCGTEREKFSHSSNEKDLEGAYRKGDDANDKSLFFSSDGIDRLKSSHSRLSVADETKDNFHLSHSTGAWTDDEKTQPNSDSGNELNFGKLRGGLRHRGYINPPYTSACQNNVPFSVNKSEEVSATRSHSTAYQSVVSSVHPGTKSSSRMPTPHYDLDTDSSEEELSQPISSDRRKEVETKPMSRDSVTYFQSTNSEVDSPENPNIDRKHMRSQFSQRTKVSPPSLETKFSSQVQVKSEPSSVSSLERKKHTQNSSDARLNEPKKDTKRTMRKSYAAETQESQNETRKSYDVGKQDISKSKMYSDEERRKTSTTEQPSSSERNRESSRSNTEAPKASGSSGNSLAKGGSTSKPSHVHPKLPDYDTIASQLQQIRMNHK